MFKRQGKWSILNQKNILKSQQESFLCNNFQLKQKNKREFETKNFNNIKSSPKLKIQVQEQEIRPKQHSFNKFIPLTTKNIIQSVQKQHKELKVPSFFKKDNFSKPINESADFLYFQRIKNQKNKQIQDVSIKCSLKQIQSCMEKQSVNNLSSVNQENKLEIKINYLMKKINEMKGFLDKKRVQKLDFLESERKERKKLFQNEDQSKDFQNYIVPLKQFITQVPKHKGLQALAHNPYSPKNSIYYVSQVLRAYREQKSLVRQHLLCSIEYLRMFHNIQVPLEKEIQHMKVNLDRIEGYELRKTLVFDLDQTLIHCNQNLNVPSDFKIKINFPTGQVIQVGINVRPFARQILAALSKKFEVIVFTASHSSYANVVLDHLDPQRKFIHHRLFRQSCYCTSQGIYIKDLRIINRPMQKMVLIDNAAYSYAFQPLNGIPIIPYYEGKNDFELQAVLKYLQSLTFVDDVREKNRSVFKLDQYHRFNDLNALVENLYRSFQS